MYYIILDIMLGYLTSGLSNKFSILDEFQLKVVFVYFLYKIVAYPVICSQLKKSKFAHAWVKKELSKLLLGSFT